MPTSDDDILAQEIGKAGALGAELGGAGHLGTSGGQIGGIVAARLLPTQAYEITILASVSPSTVVTALTSILATEGTVLSSEASPGAFEMTGLVHAGFLNMNAAILTTQIEQVALDTTSVRITGKAKEGLIKQHTAQKAVHRIANALLSRLN